MKPSTRKFESQHRIWVMIGEPRVSRGHISIMITEKFILSINASRIYAHRQLDIRLTHHVQHDTNTDSDTKHVLLFLHSSKMISCLSNKLASDDTMTRYWPFVRGIHWSPGPRASNVELRCFLNIWLNQILRTVQLRVISDTMTFIWR